ncbi:hypothetical protein Nwi_1142 [Nitrobacter winogradskyi Nb-255]|uniref:ArsR family transcriptional regulator n=1 Tax=Nitrobacter winogradskyi (strain ATCC 25391 / DSM 10237 / CIP 104748 / NCIMB 11846 / Nb-255) TaxID=323098 RepID=Q3STI7_NITWN|nr:hypothetical protein Nwi_1142 [Nitrobacter winogradskyi Nb-255]
MCVAQDIALRTHHLAALRFLAKDPDRIRLIEDENTLAAALCYVDLEKRGFVTIDNEDGMLVTITPAGLARLGAE